jgi:hypothetical protein
MLSNDNPSKIKTIDLTWSAHINTTLIAFKVILMLESVFPNKTASSNEFSLKNTLNKSTKWSSF